MKAIVTGATGLVGHAVLAALRARGHSVRVLARDPARARRLLPADAEVVQGDVGSRPDELARAMDGMDWVFHAAGIPETWQRDEAAFDRVNRLGTRNVLEASRRAGVARAVYTSTMDVFAPSRGRVVEGELDPVPKHSAYERSKVAAEREAEEVRARGLALVTVNPAAVYGPAPVRTGLNLFVERLLRGKMPALTPGGMSVVFAPGVGEAHVAAAERGRPGERYLVSDAYASVRELAEAVARAAGLPRVPPTAPAWLLRAAAHASAPAARILGFQPLITPGQLGFVLGEARVEPAKAVRELGFRPTPLEEGMARTVEWLRSMPA